MSSKNSSRASLSGWCRRTKWASFALGVSLVPHAALSTVWEDAWPATLFSVHIASTGVTIVVAVMLHLTRWLHDRTAERLLAAYDAGRATSMAVELEQLEQRIDHS